MQNALIQDGGNTGGKIVRIVAIDIHSGKTREYAYALTTGTGVSEILAINDHEFLVDERDGKGQGDGSVAKVKQLFKIDLQGAAEVSQVTGEANLAPFVVPKTLFLDIVATLTASAPGPGISAGHIPAKMEGIAFGPDVTINGHVKHTLWVANDNDFISAVADDKKVVVDNPNQFFVLAFDANDLPTYEAQSIRGDRFDDGPERNDDGH